MIFANRYILYKIIDSVTLTTFSSYRQPPKDRTLLIIEHTRVNKTVYAILASLAVCGIIMAAVFLAFNIKYRNQRYIKMSSPQLNNLIIIGCMLTYTSIVFLGLDSGLSSIGKKKNTVMSVLIFCLFYFETISISNSINL